MASPDTDEHPVNQATVGGTAAFLRPFVEAAIWLSIAGIAWIYSYDFTGKDMLFLWGAEAWPRVAIVAIAFGAVMQLILQIRQRRGARPANPEPDTASAETGAPHDMMTRIKIAATFISPLIYLYLLPRTGYYLTTPFFIGIVMYLFGVRKLKHLIGTNLCIYAVLLIVFTKVLFVPMPTGVWPGFYDFSNWFLTVVE
jgi:hypothetical protein